MGESAHPAALAGQIPRFPPLSSREEPLAHPSHHDDLSMRVDISQGGEHRRNGSRPNQWPRFESYFHDRVESLAVISSVAPGNRRTAPLLFLGRRARPTRGALLGERGEPFGGLLRLAFRGVLLDEAIQGRRVDLRAGK